MKVAIILGSIREGRSGQQVAQWALETAKQLHPEIQFDLVDLAEFNVPLLTSPTVPMAANRQYDNAEVQAWGDKINEYDAYLFVSPEYNHSVPGPFKNAVDSIGPEWVGKTAGVIGYGADGAVRATEHWRQILANFSMHVVRAQLSLTLFTEFGEKGFQPLERRTDELKTLIDQVVEHASAH